MIPAIARRFAEAPAADGACVKEGITPMEYYLIRLSYTAAAWKELIDKPASLDDRLAKVTRLIRELGGSLANYHFFEEPHFADKGKHEIVVCKFVPFGRHDIVTIMAMPDNATARSFMMAVAAEEGVKDIEMTPMISLADSLEAMARAKEVRARARYAAPGRAARGRQRGEAPAASGASSGPRRGRRTR